MLTGAGPERATMPQDPSEQADKPERLHSSVQFPYGDLDTAVEVPAAMHGAGYRECAPDQLAAAMKQQVSSGSFRGKIAVARAFGLVDTAPGRIAITDLGYRILDPSQQKKARVDSFLSVELYRKLYDEFRGKQLPPRPAALERTFERYGVSPKQTDKARQVFDRSAKQAGFFDHGPDRLILPGGLDAAERPEPSALESRELPPTIRIGGGSDGGGDAPSHLDPLIVALLHKMPKGKVWPIADRIRWLRALAINLSFVYEVDNGNASEITIEAKESTPPKS